MRRLSALSSLGRHLAAGVASAGDHHPSPLVGGPHLLVATALCCARHLGHSRSPNAASTVHLGGARTSASGRNEAAAVESGDLAPHATAAGEDDRSAPRHTTSLAVTAAAVREAFDCLLLPQGVAGVGPRRYNESVRELLQRRAALQRRVNDLLFRFPGAVASQPDLLPPILASVSYAYSVRHLLPQMESLGVSFSDAHAVMMMYSVICNALAVRDDASLSSGPMADAEAAFFIFGKARSAGVDTAAVWEQLFWAVRVLDVPPKMFDSWFSLLVDACNGSRAASGLSKDAVAAGGPPLTEPLLHFAIEWCADSRDVERAVAVWRLALQHRTAVPPTIRLCSSMLRVVERERQSDGGFARLVLDTLRSDPALGAAALRSAEWGDVLELMHHLPPRGAVELLRLRISYEPEAGGGGQRTENSERGSGRVARAGIPATQLWLSLLRTLCAQACVAEAEALFRFIGTQVRLSVRQWETVVFTMMHMYAVVLLPTPDFEGCNAVFQGHVLACRQVQPRLEPTARHYALLLDAARDAETAQQVFLEACSAGIVLPKDAFQRLYAKFGGSLPALSNRLPSPYEASPLDRALRIPADADAHAAREEAQRRRGKRRIADSTMPL